MKQPLNILVKGPSLLVNCYLAKQVSQINSVLYFLISSVFCLYFEFFFESSIVLIILQVETYLSCRSLFGNKPLLPPNIVISQTNKSNGKRLKIPDIVLLLAE